jgi:uncharacterized membrane protein
LAFPVQPFDQTIMEVLALVLFVLLILVLVIPFIALTRASNARREVEELGFRIARLEQQLREREHARGAAAGKEELSSSVTPGLATAPDVPAETFAELRAARDAVRTAVPPPVSAPTTAVPLPIPIFVAAKPEAPFPPAPGAPAFSSSDSTETAAPSATPFNWEQFMGVRLFAWLGGFALFLAAAFFVKYSFDHDLISPALRVTMGFVTGLGLLLGGLRLPRERYKITADTLCATGTVILYAVTFASHAVYRFPWFGVVPTFLLMTLITVAAFLIAVRANALVVAVLGMLGGFLTPVLINTGVDNPLALFTYIALLDLGLLAVASVRRWDWLNLAGAIGTVLMLFGWAARFYAPEKVFVAMTVFLGFCALYLIASAWARRKEQTNLWLLAATLLPPAATFVFVLWLIIDPATGTRPGVLFSFLFGADLVVLVMAVLYAKAILLVRSDGTPLPNLRWLAQAGGAVTFLLLAIWTGLRVEEPLLFWALGGYLGFALLHTVFPLVLQRRHPDEPVPLWTQLFPVLSLVLTMIPIFKFESVSFLIWPVILLIDAIAIGLAIMTASIAGILLVLVVTAGVALFWVLRIPADLAGLPEMLVVIGGMAVVFTVAGIFAGKKILARKQSSGVDVEAGFFPPGWQSVDVQQQIPALSSILPFLLLLVVTAKLPLANPTPVFGLALGLTGLLLGLTRWFNLSWLPAIGLGCTFLLEHAWHFRHFTGADPGLALGWYLIFYAVFALYPFLFHRGDGSKVVAWVTAAAAGPLHFWLIHDLVRRAWPNDFMGLVPALFALPALGGLFVALKQIPTDHPRRNTILAWFGGVALLFITLIFPIQFDRQWLTLAWALEGVALLWLFHRIPHSGLRYVGVALLLVAFARLGLNPAVFGYQPRSEIAILNWYLYSYGIVIAALFAGAKLLRPPQHRLFDKDVRPLLITLGAVLAFLLMNLEIADYFTAPGEASLVFSFRGNFARDMTYTIGWALFAFGLLVIGILRRVRPARWAGIGLLGATLLKLFFHDLATLNQLYRVGALVGVAVVAIVASFLYQKFLIKADGSEVKGSSDPAP